jgi:hypothetical protein
LINFQKSFANRVQFGKQRFSQTENVFIIVDFGVKVGEHNILFRLCAWKPFSVFHNNLPYFKKNKTGTWQAVK